MPHRQLLKHITDRLSEAFQDERIIACVQDDFVRTFRGFGLPDDKALELSKDILDQLRKLSGNQSLQVTEEICQALFYKSRVDGKRIIDTLEDKKNERAEQLYQLCVKYLKPFQLIIDWGSGDGRVTRRIYHNVSQRVVGYDTHYYPALKAMQPIPFNGENTGAKDGHFEAGLLIEALHADKDPQRIIKELKRIIKPSGKLVVIETVPFSEGPIEYFRAYFGDYLVSRIFHKSDLPVWGSYKTTDEWVSLFTDGGFDLLVEEGEGNENPKILSSEYEMVPARHVRMVFTRRADAELESENLQPEE